MPCVQLATGWSYSAGGLLFWLAGKAPGVMRLNGLLFSWPAALSASAS